MGQRVRDIKQMKEKKERMKDLDMKEITSLDFSPVILKCIYVSCDL
jgi:hypothetical protein